MNEPKNTPIYECRIGTEEQDIYEYFEPDEWLLKAPWHTATEIRVLHKGSKVPVYYRRRMVTEDEAYEMEEALHSQEF